METEEQGLLNAIAEAPDDLAPRLIFADWLEEHDDMRAPWLRDPELFEWMGITVDNPIPKLSQAWEEAIASLDYVPRDQQNTTHEKIERLGRLLGRLGEPITVYAMAQFEQRPRWPHLEPFLTTVAPHLHQYLAKLTDIANAKEQATRELALQTLLAGGRSSPEMYQVVLDCARSLDAELREVAWDTLSGASSQVRPTLVAYLTATLDKALSDDELQDSELLCFLIRLVRPELAQASDTLAVLARFLTCPNEQLVQEASHALRDVREQAMPLLGQSIRDCRPNTANALMAFVRQVAPDPVGYLCGLCLAPQPRFEVLQAALDELARSELRELARITPVFRKMLKHDLHKVRLAAVEAMRCAWGSDLRLDYVRLYEEAWEGQSEEIKAKMIYATRDLTSMTRDAFPLLVRALSDALPTVRATSASVLNDADHSDRIYERMQRRLESKDEHERAEAILASCEFIPYREEMIDGLGRSLMDESPVVRRSFWQGITGKIDAHPKFIKLLRRGLGDSHASVVQAAILAVPSLNMLDEVLPELIEMGYDDSAKVRAGACEVLVHRADDPSVRKVLMRGFRDEERVLEAVVRGLADSSYSSEFLPEVMKLAGHRSATIRKCVQHILRNNIAEEVSPEFQAAVRRGLADVNDTVVNEAIQTLSIYPEHASFAYKEALQVLDYDWPNMDFSYQLANAFKEMPEAAEELVKRLEHPREKVRWVAYYALETLLKERPDGRDELVSTIVPVLLKRLPKELGDNLSHAIALVGVLGPRAVECYPFLQQAIERPFFEAREAALRAIGKLGPKAARSKLTLLRIAEREDDRNGCGALLGLVHLAAHERDLLPYLQRRLTGSSDYVGDLLREIADVPALAPEIIPAVFHVLESHSEEYYRQQAAETLAQLGAAMVPFVDRLCDVLRTTQDEGMQLQIIDALGTLGEHAIGAERTLAYYIERGSKDFRKKIAEELQYIPLPKQAAWLGKLLHDPDRGVRVQAGYSLDEIGDAALPALPDIIKVVTDPKWDGNLDRDGNTIDHEADYAYLNNSGQDLRQFLLTTIRNIGPAAESAIPILASMMKDRNELLVRYVIWALGGIGAAAVPTLKHFAKKLDDSFQEIIQQELDDIAKGPSTEQSQ